MINTHMNLIVFIGTTIVIDTVSRYLSNILSMVKIIVTHGMFVYF